MKGLRIFAIISLVILLLIGCSSTDESNNSKTTESKDGPVTLEVAFNAQPPTMDPLMTTAVVTRDITRHIYESLVTMNENYEVEPMLAESYDVSEDGKTITFKLREGIKFHNGEEMTVEDVVASLDRWRNTAGLGKTHFSDAEISAEGDDTVDRKSVV